MKKKPQSLGRANEDDLVVQVEIEAAYIMVGDPTDSDHTCPDPCVQCCAWALVRQILGS